MAERLTRQEAIRAKCLDCCCGHQSEVRKCEIYACPLWRYRISGKEEEPPEAIGAESPTA